jgi:hypothetical protein
VALAGSANALTAAAPLAKDDVPQRPRHSEPPKAPAAAGPKRVPVAPKRPVIQKIGIVSSLLALGCIRPAIAILTTFPWLVESHPEIADLLLRILQVSISPLFKTHFPVDQDHVLAINQIRTRWTPSGSNPSSERKQQLTFWAPVPPSTVAVEYHFFYPSWARSIPLCQTDDDMITIVQPILSIIGHQIHRDLNFFTKLCQIAKPQLQQKVRDIYKLHLILTVPCAVAGGPLAWRLVSDYPKTVTARDQYDQRAKHHRCRTLEYSQEFRSIPTVATICRMGFKDHGSQPTASNAKEGSHSRGQESSAPSLS